MALPEQDSVEQLIEAARAAARQDRNQQSADLFARAIARDPSRRQQLLQEYADQLTYSSRAVQATGLYAEILASRPDAPQRERALKGLGLALLWSNRPGEARTVYEAWLIDDPASHDARRGLGRALSWGGRQREAEAVYTRLLRDHPDDAEARVQLAQAQAWMGRPDRSRATLEAGRVAGREDARRLLAELSQAQSPQSRLETQRSTQSDRISIGALQVGHEMSFDRGLGRAGARMEALEFEREDHTDSARTIRQMVYGRYRFSDGVELNAGIGNEHITPRGSPSMDRLVYASWLTLWPNDVVRVDLSANRSTLDNLRSLRMGLTFSQNGVSIDLTPTERQRYSARAETGIFSDGNRRHAGQLQAEYRFLVGPELWAGIRHSRMSFEKQLDNGYFNPKEFQATLLTARVAHRLGGYEGRWTVAASAAGGREEAEPGGRKPTYEVSIRGGWQVQRATRIEARLGRFSSRTSSSSGFARTSAGLSLEHRW